MKVFSEITRLKEHSKKYPEQKEMQKELFKDNEALVIDLSIDVEEVTDYFLL